MFVIGLERIIVTARTGLVLTMRSSVVLFGTLYYTLPIVGRVSVWQVGVGDYVQRQHMTPNGFAGSIK